jgi:FtsP/CotA-like multicopper oxidase with cupredoxin domain
VKRIVIALAIAVATAAAASAQTTKPEASKPAHEMKAPAAKATSMKAEVVSTDPAAKTITVKDAAGVSTTLTATGGAVASLATVKAGDWVTVTKSENNATHIAKTKAPGEKKPAKADKK